MFDEYPDYPTLRSRHLDKLRSLESPTAADDKAYGQAVRLAVRKLQHAELQRNRPRRRSDLQLNQAYLEAMKAKDAAAKT